MTSSVAKMAWELSQRAIADVARHTSGSCQLLQRLFGYAVGQCQILFVTGRAYPTERTEAEGEDISEEWTP